MRILLWHILLIFLCDKKWLIVSVSKEIAEYFNANQEISKMVKFLDDQSYKTWIKNYNVKLKNLKDFL
jgi:hypothetical protein